MLLSIHGETSAPPTKEGRSAVWTVDFILFLKISLPILEVERTRALSVDVGLSSLLGYNSRET